VLALASLLSAPPAAAQCGPDGSKPYPPGESACPAGPSGGSAGSAGSSGTLCDVCGASATYSGVHLCVGSAWTYAHGSTFMNARVQRPSTRAAACPSGPSRLRAARTTTRSAPGSLGSALVCISFSLSFSLPPSRPPRTCACVRPRIKHMRTTAS